MAQNSVEYTVNLNGNALQGMARLDNATNKVCAACQKANSQTTGSLICPPTNVAAMPASACLQTFITCI